MFFRDVCQFVLEHVEGLAVEFSAAYLLGHFHKWKSEKH